MKTPSSPCETFYNVTITNMCDCFQNKNKCKLPLHLNSVGGKCLYTYMGDPFVIMYPSSPCDLQMYNSLFALCFMSN